MCTLFLLFSFLQVTVLAVKPQAELFSPLVPQKVLATFNALPSPVRYPQYSTTAGIWQYFPPDTWTSGFSPVTGYALNTRKNLCGASDTNRLGTADWLALSRAASTGLIPLEVETSVGHDVGFLSFPFVEELIVNPSNETAKTAVNTFAQALAARFNGAVGCTRSWDSADPTDFKVIIDNMMNLEVLFQSEALTGNHTLREIAISHANTTMKNHIRADGGTWHVVEYNSTTGSVIRKVTAQGYADNSTWSRGQAWAIYGFANMYKHIKDDSYLLTARRVANYFLKNLPQDGVVPWDFNAPLVPAPRPADSSAATIAATGLLLLAKHESSSAAAKMYSDAAINLLNTIINVAWSPSWQSILANGTVNKPANNALTGTVYGDYYFIKAGSDLVSHGLADCK